MKPQNKNSEKKYYFDIIDFGNKKIAAYIEINEADNTKPLRFKTMDGANYERIGSNFFLVQENRLQK